MRTRVSHKGNATYRIMHRRRSPVDVVAVAIAGIVVSHRPATNVSYDVHQDTRGNVSIRVHRWSIYVRKEVVDHGLRESADVMVDVLRKSAFMDEL